MQEPPLDRNVVSKENIFKLLCEVRKSREEQRNQFRNTQLQELQEKEKNVEDLRKSHKEKQKQLVEKPSTSAPEANKSYENESESSVIQHLRQCFSDSSQNSNAIQEVGGSKCTNNAKPKFPYLKRGSGLSRYQPNPHISVNKRHQSKGHPKPALKKKSDGWKNPNFTTTQSKCIRFEVPLQQPKTSTLDVQCNTIKGQPSNLGVSDKFTTDDAVASDHSSLEKKELAEFELLEDCAQNSSFNSESSIVQKVLRGESLLSPKPSKQNYRNDVITELPERVLDPETSTFPTKANFSKYLEEIQSQKHHLRQLISEYQPQIASLEREIEMCVGTQPYDKIDDTDSDSRSCSTPVAEVDPSLLVLNPDLDLFDSDKASSSDSSPDGTNVCATASGPYSCDTGPLSAEGPNCNKIKEKESASNSKNKTPTDPKPNEKDKSKFHQKLKELEDEIAIYQEQNSKSLELQKEREKIVNQLRKEQEAFKKFKEAEKKKLESELEEERRQLKRQKETFLRYQKLRKDNPTKKERDELCALRTQVEKLQEELKRQSIKSNTENRRLRNQSIAIERERDSLKMENIRLEGQCEDLLTALKRRSKKSKPKAKQKCTIATETDEEIIGTKDVQIVEPELKVLESSKPPLLNEVENNEDDNECPRARVRFNLEPDFKSYEEYDSGNDNCEESDGCAEESDTDTPSYKDIPRGDKIERIYCTGDKEIIFMSGTRKYISADGLVTKVSFYNGDVKQMFPDGRDVYKYADGTAETHFPDGLQVIEFPNGQIQRRYPDGTREINYDDGTTHRIYTDGSEEIHGLRDFMIKRSADGTQTIEFQNGQKEIRTPTFKRREYPDGSVKIIYENGRSETRYASSGRIRIKDETGKIIIDTKYITTQKGQPGPLS